MATMTLLRARLEKPVFQSFSGDDPFLGVILQHAQQQVLKLGVVGNRVAGFAGASSTGPSRFYSQYLVQGSAAG